MKKWLRISAALLIVIIAGYGYRQWSGHSLSASVEEVRRQLRQENFRTDISDFDFALPPELTARANTIVSAGQAARSMRHAHELQLMEMVGTNTALAISPVEIIETSQATNLWPFIKAELRNDKAPLDRACAALLAGPLKFQPTVRPRGDILLPYLADEKNLARALAVRAVLAMHEHDTNDVFTNLFALSRSVTAWRPEPMDIAHMVRFACQGIAQQAIWESVQTDCWNEAPLAALQREWESVRLFDVGGNALPTRRNKHRRIQGSEVFAPRHHNEPETNCSEPPKPRSNTAVPRRRSRSPTPPDCCGSRARAICSSAQDVSAIPHRDCAGVSTHRAGGFHGWQRTAVSAARRWPIPSLLRGTGLRGQRRTHDNSKKSPDSFFATRWAKASCSFQYRHRLATAGYASGPGFIRPTEKESRTRVSRDRS